MHYSKLYRSLQVMAVAVLSAGTLAVMAQSDVTQPSDPIYASSDNNPGSEGVANSIDNTDSKYLNFDAADGTDVGFVVTPSVGLTRVTGMTLKSANDAPERDPAQVRLEGSNDDTVTDYASGNWTVIYENLAIPAFTARFEVQTFSFDNFVPYKHYRWTVLEVADVAAANSMQIAEVELLGKVVPTDVTQPSDPIYASSDNNPGSEGVANSIDNTDSKYLNFDAADGTDVGFVVTPAVGITLATGISMKSANDAPERDPAQIRLEGSNDDTVTDYASGNWTVIYENLAVPAFTARFEVQTFLFDNFIPYKHYRWTVLEVADVAAANSMQIAEVEILGAGVSDVTQPSDAIVASSDNNPGSEGVANSIDNTDSKYLNFDAADGTDVGFVVTPAIGKTTVIGMTLKSANDAPERDPAQVRLEGSNDDIIPDYASGSWTVIYENLAIPAFTARFQIQSFFFANETAYKHYRWTVLEVADVAAANSMQIAEVELLAVTDTADCTKARILRPPVNAHVLSGERALFKAQLNGPWPVQWYRNGMAIAGATKPYYISDPVTAANADDLYHIEIRGCEASPSVKAELFTPSSVKSIGLSWAGEGANGTPTEIGPNEVAGVHLQAYWNNLTNQNDSLVPLVDSDNQASAITVSFTSSGEWGAGTAGGGEDDTPTQKILNGLIHADPNGSLTFTNVPAGSHSVLLYTVGIPLQFQNEDYTVTGANSKSVYTVQINKEQYLANPNWVRGTSPDPNVRTLANFVRFDQIAPSANGTITVNWSTDSTGFDRGVALNAAQLLIDPPYLGEPPSVVQGPQPTETLAGATVTLDVLATGDNLAYQWTKGGLPLSNGSGISGVTSPTLTIVGFAPEDVGFYGVEVSNVAGAVITDPVKVKIVSADRTITDNMIAHFTFDESSGSTAANTGSDAINGTVTDPDGGYSGFRAGQIGNAVYNENLAYVYVPNYTKFTQEATISLWVKASSENLTFLQDVPFVRNAIGDFGVPSEQFDFGLIFDDADPLNTRFRLRVSVGVGPNTITVNENAAFPLDSWQHVAFTINGGSLRLYHNGALVGSSAYIGNINQPATEWLSVMSRLIDDGAGGLIQESGNEQTLIGEIDDLGIWLFAWPESVVKSIYDQGETGQNLTTASLPILPEPPTLITIDTYSYDGATLSVTWSGGGEAYVADSVNGPWTATGSSGGSHSESVAAGNKFIIIRSGN